MILIVESGATKSNWIAVDRSGKEFWRSTRDGMNVSAMDSSIIIEIIKSGIKESGLQEVEGFYLYISGVMTDGICFSLKECISKAVKCKEIDIQDDLMGAARGVCGNKPGIVAILGTGSNACLYDGNNVCRKVYSGGFILGDEGSAAALGRIFIGDFLKGVVPTELAVDFQMNYDSNYQSIVRNVYHGIAPSAYLGGFVPFLLSHYQDSGYVRRIVKSNFQSFIDRNLSAYDTGTNKVNVVGSFGNACRDIIIELAEAQGISIGDFIISPLEGLVRYHLAD